MFYRQNTTITRRDSRTLIFDLKAKPLHFKGTVSAKASVNLIRILNLWMKQPWNRFKFSCIFQWFIWSIDNHPVRLSFLLFSFNDWSKVRRLALPSAIKILRWKFVGNLTRGKLHLEKICFESRSVSTYGTARA